MKKIRKFILISASVVGVLPIVNAVVKQEKEEVKGIKIEWKKQQKNELFKSKAPNKLLEIEIGEKVFSKSGIDIYYNGDEGVRPVFIVEVKDLSKHYQASIIQLPNTNKNNNAFFKEDLGDHIYNDLLKNRTTQGSVGWQDFHFMTSVRGENGSAFTDNNEVDFLSSWGVYNSGSATSQLAFGASNELIHRNYLDQSWDDVIFETVTPRSAGILPLIGISNPPIERATYNLSGITTNGIYSAQNKDRNVVLPDGAGKGLDWWSGIFNAGKLLIGAGVLVLAALAIYYAGGTLQFAAGVVSALGGIGIIYNWITNKVESLPPTEDEEKLDELFESVNEDHVSFDFGSPISFDGGAKEVIKANGSLWATANATALFGGDRTVAKWYDALADVRADATFRKFA